MRSAPLKPSSLASTSTAEPGAEWPKPACVCAVRVPVTVPRPADCPAASVNFAPEPNVPHVLHGTLLGPRAPACRLWRCGRVNVADRGVRRGAVADRTRDARRVMRLAFGQSVHLV